VVSKSQIQSNLGPNPNVDVLRFVAMRVVGWLLVGFMIAPLVCLGQEPFYELREHETLYNGPGREDLEPRDLEEVLIGYFGPGDPNHPEGGDLWLAAQLALEDANREGGYRGLPFQLRNCWSRDPWGTGISQLAQMVYSEDVWAIVGSIDGASTHLAEQVVAKARLPLLSPVSTDKTVNLANVPWMFSLLPGDHQITPVLARAIVDRVEESPFAIASSTDHDSRLLVDELRVELAGHDAVPSYHLQFHPNGDVVDVVHRVMRSSIETVVIAAGAHDSGRLVQTLRAEGFRGDIFGGPSLGRRAFLETAQEEGNGVVFPILASVDDSFAERFKKRFGRAPDYAAAQTYDALLLLVKAIRSAGLNRSKIRDVLVELAPWTGVSGSVEWDPLGQNVRPVRLENSGDSHQPKH